MSMKKFKKLLAGLLTGAMMLGSMSLTAFGAQTTTPDVIDTTLKGNLTIHKYEYNGTGGNTGTGSEKDKAPEGANPLAGAGFTIYKVADVDELTSYYNANPLELPSVDTYVEDGAIKSGYTAAKAEAITGIDGIAKFTDLDLGFYVVIETTKPAAVTDAMEPFIVSIPMTTVDGANWLYDVHTYPKNGTSYGKITLEKSGEDTAKLEGVTFVLQKKNADNTWKDITKKAGAAGDNTGDELNLTTNASGLISVDGLTQGTYRFIETSVGNNYGYIMDGATAYTFTVNADGKVTYGETTNASVTIPVSNEKPDLDKQVNTKTDPTTGEWQEAADYSVGDKVPYKVTVDVPANIEKLRYFAVTDTPVGLEDDISTIVIKCGESTLVKDTDYIVVKKGKGFTITFIDKAAELPRTISEAFKSCADKEIEITYKAKLLEGAVTTTVGNPNTASLDYSNKILPENDPGNPNIPEQPTEEPGKDSIKDETVVYTFKLGIHKTGKDSASTSNLQDVKFDLYKEVTSETANAITGDDAKDTGLDTTKYWLKINTDSLTTDADGNVSYNGLANGTYYLVETETNAGYNLLKAPVEVVLQIVYKTTWNETTTWTVDPVTGEKTITKHDVNNKSETFTGTDDTNTADGIDGLKQQEIVNKKGFTLPTTGGMGTVIFTIVGMILAFAGVLLITASRKKAAK